MKACPKAFFAILLAGACLLTATMPAVAYRAFISNEKDNTVSVIDTKTFKVVHTIKVGQRRAGSSSPRTRPGF